MAGQISDKVKQKRRELAMAAQHEVAVEVAESFVGRNIKVLVEKEATAHELKGARISSWEHGLMRGADEGLGELNKGKYWMARGEADAPDIDGRVYVKAGGKSPKPKFSGRRIRHCQNRWAHGLRSDR